MIGIRIGRIICLIIVAMFFLTGCITTITTTAPVFYTHSPNTEFEVLGTVAVQSGTRVGYIDLFEAARRQFPGTDFVIDIMIDRHRITTSYTAMISLFARMFRPEIRGREVVRYEYAMRGTAIRYTNRAIHSPISRNYTVERVVGNVQRVDFTPRSTHG